MDLNAALFPATWPQHEARALDRFIVGLDIGKSIDPTAICVLRHVVEPLTTWTKFDTKRIWRQDKKERFHVVHLERIELNTPYPQQVAHVRSLLARAPLNHKTPLVADGTGCGAPVLDLFEDGGLRPERILITAGNEVSQHGGREWHVPKSVLISNLESRMHTAELKVAPALREAGALAEELKDFEAHVSDAGRTTWGARVGRHDDIVLACSLAVWWAVRTAMPSITCGPLPF